MNRACDECNACCTWLTCSVNNVEFPSGESCYYLNEQCSIYKNRPDVCRNFECAWYQNFFPEWMRPDQCGVLIYFQPWSQGQYLRVLETNGKMSMNVFKEIQYFLGTYHYPALIQYGGKLLVRGSEAFRNEKKQLN